MKIAWLKESFKGGANVSNNLFINKGRGLAHEITTFIPENLQKEDVGQLAYYDLIVLSNINSFELEVIQWVIDNKKYVTLTHDVNFCKTRNARCDKCKDKCQPAKIFRDMYQNADKNIFFSPLQIDIHRDFFGETMRDAICIPAPIEDNKFYPDKNIQQDAYLYAGTIMTHKGVHQILDFADSQKGTGKVFHFAGKAVNEELMARIKKDYTYLGEIPYEEMPQLYRKYKHFLFNSQMHESFCLTIIEALLSGCSIIKFRKTFKTGMESYNLNPNELIKMCIKAPETFWNEVLGDFK